MSEPRPVAAELRARAEKARVRRSRIAARTGRADYQEGKADALDEAASLVESADFGARPIRDPWCDDLAYIEELEGRSHGLREDLSWALDCLELCLKRIEAVDGSRPNLADVGLAKARAQLALASDEGLARYSTFVPIGNDLMPLLGVEWTDPIQIKLVDGELIAREPAPKEETTDDE